MHWGSPLDEEKKGDEQVGGEWLDVQWSVVNGGAQEQLPAMHSRDSQRRLLLARAGAAARATASDTSTRMRREWPAVRIEGGGGGVDRIEGVRENDA